jgi:hypothetical protein
MIFVGTIGKNFEIKEEFLKLQPVTTGTKGSDVFEAINKVVSEFNSLLPMELNRSKTVLVGYLK